MTVGVHRGMSAAASPPNVAHQIDEAEGELYRLSVEAQRADWVYNTYVNPDSEAISAAANARLIARTVELVKRLPHDSVLKRLPAVSARKAQLLRVALTLVAPSEGNAAEELTRIVNRMQATYATGRHAVTGGAEPLDLQGLSRILAEQTDPAVLEDAWTGWHRVGRAMRSDFTRYVELANRGSRELGFEDTGAMWRSRYDMAPEEFAREVERLWLEVRPLYQALHTFVRRRLFELYGERVAPSSGPIPIHLLGNMWGQSWENLIARIGPAGIGPGYDLTKILIDRGTTPEQMVRYAERFFVSVGLDPLPETFWKRSMLVRPADREVVCHASAWDIDFVEDLRIKMCIEITGEDFQTIHHELGHNYYQRAYSQEPFLFRDSAHDGFHEAVGDTIGLSVTPEYLRQIDLLHEVPGEEQDIGLLLRIALEKVAFLPFGLAVDRWRWKVFSEEISPKEYTESWWAVRREYQGVRPPAARTEEEFDPGAKFHVPANVPYMRYFLAHILQFQFHRALARTIGWKGALHRCSIYGRKEAGEKLGAMLRMGASREWPEALETITGERRMSSEGLREYFRPLERWLADQNRGQKAGW